MKKQVLNKVIIAFTADVIPTKLKDPTLSWIWQMATSFGAICSMDLTGKTTHLIAVKASSSKVKAAREYGHSIHVVTPAWLLDSTARWKSQNEAYYALPEVDVENPENTSLDDLEDSAFDDEGEQDNNEPEEEEVIENVDWDEADREVEDFINESGIDDVWDTEDSDTVDRYAWYWSFNILDIN
jgi:RNA polymerase II subunit A-like phosphatase